MKLLAILPLALAASGFVIPNDETLEALTSQEQQPKSHPFWDSNKDPSKFWDELEKQFDRATAFIDGKLKHAADRAHEIAAEYSEDFTTAFAGQAWLDSAKNELHPPSSHHCHHPPPHHGPPPPHHGPPHCGPPPPHHGPPPPHHGPPHCGPPPPPPPHCGHPPPPHCGPPPPHHGPPHCGPPPPHCGPPHGPPPHKRPHYPPHIKLNKTVYQILNESEYTTKLAGLINRFPDLVDLLNATEANYTIFAPIDSAFEKIPKGAPEPPEEFLKKLLTYHVSPELYPVPRILVSRTIPTALEAEFIGNNSQRLSTQLSFFGLTVNFYSRVIAVDVFGTNGVIHGLDSILLPPPLAVDILEILPTVFSTLTLGIVKTDLYDAFNDTSLHTGGTLFAPTNFAFSLLGPLINAFLFSEYGTPYLRALLLYHAVPDITLYSDAIYKAENSSADGTVSGQHIPIGQYHIDLPTGLENRSLSVDVGRFGRLVDMRINGFLDVSILDGIAADGVIHLISRVLIPPREPGAMAEAADGLTLEEFKERLAPYVEAEKTDQPPIDDFDWDWEL